VAQRDLRGLLFRQAPIAPTPDAIAPDLGGGGDPGRQDAPANPVPRAGGAGAGRFCDAAGSDRRARLANCGAVGELGNNARLLTPAVATGDEVVTRDPAASVTTQLIN
jgi:hypothetical protein